LQKIEKLKQLLINKYTIYGTFAIWALLKSFAPIPHINTAEPYISVVTPKMFNLIIYLPLVMFILLYFYRKLGKRGKDIKLWNIFNTNTFILLGYLMLVAIIILQIYSLNVTQIAAHGSLITCGMLMSLSMTIVYKLRNMPGITSIIISLMAFFWVIGFYEIPYQICRYYLSNYNLLITEKGIDIIIIREIYLIVPFIIAIAVWKIKTTRLSSISMAAFVILWVIWIVPGHFQTLFIVNLDISTTHSIFNNPINWIWYTIAKTCKVFVALFVLSLDYRNLAREETRSKYEIQHI